MDDLIIWIIEQINNLIIFTADTSALTTPLSSFMDKLYEFSVEIMNFVSKPVAYVILSLFFTFELYKISMQVENAGGGNELGVQIVVRTMIKMVVAKMAIDKADKILNVIFDTSLYLTESIKEYISSEPPTQGIIDSTEIREALKDQSFWIGINVAQIFFIAFLIIIIALIISIVIVGIRFFELYIYIAISPIPLATLIGGEMSQIGKSFLKSFAAVSIQGTLIFLVLSYFPYLMSSPFLQMKDSSAIIGSLKLFLSLINVIIYSLVLIAALFATNKWSKALTNSV